MGEKRVAYIVLVGKLEGEGPLGNSCVESRIILK